MITRQGSALVAASVGCLVGGLALGYLPIVGMGCSGLAAVLVAQAWVARPPKIELTRQLRPERVSRGAPAICLLRAVVRSGRAVRSTLVVDHVGDREVSVHLPVLRPGRVFEVPYRLDTSRRGVHQVGPLAWLRNDPFGLAACRKGAGQVQHIVVWPAVHHLDGVPAQRMRLLEGPRANPASKAGNTFDGLRDYAAGDDLRLVHWRSTARMGTLMVREHIDTSMPTATVVLDTDPASYPDDQSFEEAVDLTASVASGAIRGGLPLRLRCGSQRWVSTSARAPTAPLLDLLAGVNPQPDSPLRIQLPSSPGNGTSGALIIITGSQYLDFFSIKRAARGYETGVVAAVGGDGHTAVTGCPRLRMVRAAGAREICALWATLGAWQP